METMTHTPLNVDLKKMDYKPLSENWHQTCMPQRICVYLILQFISSKTNGLFVFSIYTTRQPILIFINLGCIR